MQNSKSYIFFKNNITYIWLKLLYVVHTHLESKVKFQLLSTSDFTIFFWKTSFDFWISFHGNHPITTHFEKVCMYVIGDTEQDSTRFKKEDRFLWENWKYTGVLQMPKFLTVSKIGSSAGPCWGVYYSS